MPYQIGYFSKAIGSKLCGRRWSEPDGPMSVRWRALRAAWGSTKPAAARLNRHDSAVR